MPAALEAAHKKFAELRLRAEAGELDVAWARKVQHSDKMAELSREQKRDPILDDEFGPTAAQSASSRGRRPADRRP